MTKKSVSLKND
jgi:hypothetical protein